MFGYIKPLKQELKIKDYEAYRGVYCGLCKELGRTFGPFARLTLSYDFAFLSIVETAVSDESACFEHKDALCTPLTKGFAVKAEAV